MSETRKYKDLNKETNWSHIYSKMLNKFPREVGNLTLYWIKNFHDI